MKVVIIGGVAGGATAAARLRRLDEQAQIVVLEKTGFVSYANCGLPYYIGGVIEDESDLTLQTPQSFAARFGVDVRIKNEALAIDRQNKTVLVRDLQSGQTYQEHYDKLILSPGATPTVPFALPQSDRIFTLRTVEDTKMIHAFVRERGVRTAVIAGGGFIGVELAENLCEQGIAVTLVQQQAQLLTPLDADMASFVQAKMRQKGVRLMLSCGVKGFVCDAEQVTAQSDEAQIPPADMAVVAIGVTPDSALARQAGLTLGLRGSIVVDTHMRTSDPDIYAVGDAVQVRHRVTGGDAVISLAGPANKQGRIAADHICGIDSAFAGSLGSSVIKVFELTAASTGLNERMAREAGLDYDRVVLSPASHATYYPGAGLMTMKVLFEKKTQRILGAQIVGTQGVDKRIDVLATAIFAGMTAQDLMELDLAYAPPYSSAKDPVNMAGFMIDNVARGLVKQMHWDTLDTCAGYTLLDTRTPREYARGHADGFINIPLDELRGRLEEIPRDRPVCVMCQSGLRSYIACRILMQHGFDCSNFSGGYRFYASVKSQQCAADKAAPCGAETL
jgi:NADPH-dependent 2,4-dienoyl-CoA reductase/sulfur reductase-like enzyme/rhodanese-related sulfurtransferase